MSDLPPPASPPPPLIPPPPLPPAGEPLRDRRTGLKVFGIFEIILGSGILLMIPFTLLGSMMKVPGGPPSPGVKFLLPSLLLMALGGAGFIWLGVGSFLIRRWARALLLILGWMGLVAGVISMAILPFTLSTVDEALRQQGQELPPAVIFFTKAVMVVTTAIIYVAIPAALVLFYRSRHVKRTCEVFDPVERWTDRRPLPVIGACVLLAGLAACVVVMLPTFGGMIPLGGIAVTGWPARFFWLAVAALALWCARGFYRLERRAWIIWVAAMLVFWVGYIYFLNAAGLKSIYLAAGMPEEQVERIVAMPLLRGSAMTWLCILGGLPYVVFFGWLWRYFPAAKERPAAV